MIGLFFNPIEGLTTFQQIRDMKQFDYVQRNKLKPKTFP